MPFTSLIVKLFIKHQLVVVLASILLIVMLVVKGLDVLKECEFEEVDDDKGDHQALEGLVPQRHLLRRSQGNVLQTVVKG